MEKIEEGEEARWLAWSREHAEEFAESEMAFFAELKRRKVALRPARS